MITAKALQVDEDNGAPATVAIPVPYDFVPQTPADLKVCLSDPHWRINSGQLYNIMIKGKDENGDEDDSAEALVVPFKPNRAQRQLLKKLHTRNIILKARQLGFTTFICILFLDCALFRPDIRAGIVAHNDDAAKAIFRDKVKFAYERLPDALRQAMPLKRDSAEELLFAHNNSSIRVSTSMRGGTLHYLHVSEFGKICAKFPERAREVVTGSIPAVPLNGMIFIESTAEGRDGSFFKMCQRAEKLSELGRRLVNKEYRFHFYPWWDELAYRIDPENVIISANDDEYFDKIEVEMGTVIDIEQRAWWISTRDNDFSGEEEKMWQEYPSTPKEAFQKSSQGCYYSVQMTRARKEKRITTVPYTPGLPVHTFWDIGAGDGTAIWFVQKVGQWYHVIDHLENWGESYSYYANQLLRKEYVYGRHYLPHDGNHVRQGEDQNLTPREMLENLGLRNVEIVPRVSEVQHGIQAVRNIMALCRFDEEKCKEGIDHLDSYRKTWSERLSCFTDEPVHDIHSESADAFRQLAQSMGAFSTTTEAGRRPKRRNKGGMAA